MNILQLNPFILPHTTRYVWIWSVLDVAASAGYLCGFLHLGANLIIKLPLNENNNNASI